MKIKKVNENELNIDLMKSIDKLIDNLSYLNKFIDKNFKEDNVDFHKKLSVIKTDIKLLSNKLNYKK